MYNFANSSFLEKLIFYAVLATEKEVTLFLYISILPFFKVSLSLVNFAHIGLEAIIQLVPDDYLACLKGLLQY